jgi:hypothetical protein
MNLRGAEAPSRQGQRSTPTSARGKHAHNPYGASVLVPNPTPPSAVVGGQSPEDTDSSTASDQDRPRPTFSLSLPTEMWPVGPWTCFHRPLLGKLKFVPYPAQAQLASVIPMEDELLRQVKHQLHQRPDLSHAVKTRDPNLAAEMNRLAVDLLHRRTQVRIFVGNLWTDLPVGFCQWLLEELWPQPASSSDPERDSPQGHRMGEPGQGSTPRAPYLVNASYHQTASGVFRGCFHATLHCDTDPTPILRRLHHRILLDRCGYWVAQGSTEMNMLKEYTTDLLAEQTRLKAAGTTTAFWSLPRSAMSWELVENHEFSRTDPANVLQQMKRSRRCLPLPPSIPCAILPKSEPSFERQPPQPQREDAQP